MLLEKILCFFVLVLLQCEFFAEAKNSRKIAENLEAKEEDFVNILEGFIKDGNDDLENDEKNNTNKTNVPHFNEKHKKNYLLATKVTKELAAGTAAVAKFIFDPKKDKFPNFVSRFKQVTGVLGAAGAMFSIISLFLPKEESEISKLNKKMVEEFKNVNKKLDNIATKIDKLEDIIPFEVQRAQYISDKNMVVQARKQLTVLADLLLNVDCQDNKTCAIEKTIIVERYVNDILQSEKLKLVSSKLFSGISTTKGYFQENMLELVNKFYECDVPKNYGFVEQVVGLTFQAHEVIIVSEVLQGNKAEIVGIVDQWINDLSLIELKLSEVNKDCYDNMEHKIRKELSKKLQEYQEKNVEPQNATTRIFKFLEEKYEWIGWLVLQRPVFKKYLCTEFVFFQFKYSIDANDRDHYEVIIVEYLETYYNYAKDISETIIQNRNRHYSYNIKYYSTFHDTAWSNCGSAIGMAINNPMDSWYSIAKSEKKLIKSQMILDRCSSPCRRKPVHLYSKGISKNQFFTMPHDNQLIFGGSGVLPPTNEETVLIILKLSINEEKKLKDTCERNCLNGECLSRPFTSKYFCVCNKDYHGEKCESKLRIKLLKEINEIVKIGMKIPRISDVFFGLKNLESKFDKQNQKIFKQITFLNNNTKLLQSSIDELTFSTAKNFNDLEDLVLLRFKETESGINEIQNALSTAYEMYNKKIDNLEQYLGQRFDWVELKVLYSEAIYNLNCFIQKFRQGQKTGTSENKDFFKQFSACDISSSKIEKWMKKLHDLINGQKDDIELLTHEPILKLFIKVYSRGRCEKYFKALVDSQWSQLQLLQLNGYILWKEFLDFKNIDASFVNAKMKESITLQIETMKRITCNKIDIKYSTSAQCTGDEFGYALIDEDKKLECAFGFLPSNETVSCDTYDQVECLSCYCSKSELNSKYKCPSKQQIINYYTQNTTCKFGYYPYISCTPDFHVECKSCYSALHKDLQARSKCPTDEEIRQHYLKNLNCNTGTYPHIPIDDESDIECKETNVDCDNVYKQWIFCQCNSAGNWNSYIPVCHFEKLSQCANYLRQRFGGESLPVFNNKNCTGGTWNKCEKERDILRTDDLDFWKFYVLIFGFNDFFHEKMQREDWKSILSILLHKAYSKGYEQACQYGFYIAGKDFNFECRSCYGTFHISPCPRSCPSDDKIINYYTQNTTCKFGYYPSISLTPDFHVECKSCYSTLHKDLQARSKCPTDEEIRQHYLKNLNCNTGTYPHIPIDDESDIECKETNVDCDNVYKQWIFCQCNSAGNWNSYIPVCHFERFYQCANYLRQRFGGESLPVFNSKNCKEGMRNNKCGKEKEILRTDNLDFWKFYVLIFGFNDFFHEKMQREDWKSTLYALLHKAYSKGYEQACRYGFYIAGKDFNFECRSCYGAFHFSSCARSACPSDDKIKRYYLPILPNCTNTNEYAQIPLKESSKNGICVKENVRCDSILSSYNTYARCTCTHVGYMYPGRMYYPKIQSDSNYFVNTLHCPKYFRERYGGQALPHYKFVFCLEDQCCVKNTVPCTSQYPWNSGKSIFCGNKTKALSPGGLGPYTKCNLDITQTYHHLSKEKFAEFWKEMIRIYGYDDFVITTYIVEFKNSYIQEHYQLDYKQNVIRKLFKEEKSALLQENKL